MGDKRETIMYVAKDAGDIDKIIIWTSTFRAEGRLYKEKEKFERNVVTLQDAHICNHVDICACDSRSAVKWLNIFEDEIVSFSLVK